MNTVEQTALIVGLVAAVLVGLIGWSAPISADVAAHTTGGGLYDGDNERVAVPGSTVSCGSAISPSIFGPCRMQVTSRRVLATSVALLIGVAAAAVSYRTRFELPSRS